MSRIALALVLALGATVARAGDVKRQPAESNESFTCRAAQIPVARRCFAQCDATYTYADQADARSSCIQACTVSSLWAISDCRVALASGHTTGAKAPAAAPVASR